MENLYIDRKGTRIDTEAGRLILHLPDTPRPVSLPLRQLRFVVLSTAAQLSTTVLLALHRADVTLVVTNPRRDDTTLVCGGASHGNTARRMRQYSWVADDDRRLESARQILHGKLISEYRALARHRRRRADLRRPLTQAMERIRERRDSLPTATTLNALRGIEGAAAAAYYHALARLIAPSWQFPGRRRRPTPDPVNALLSLTYTLLHGEAVRALLGCGLDPALGCLHDLDYGRESLACDLVELLRADADTWVLRLLRDNTLRPTHFHHPEPGRCLLNKDGRAIYYNEYQAPSHDWRKRSRRLAQQWAAQLGSIEDILRAEGEDVEPPKPDD
jgi:CRISPR-associated protein Cas1